MSRYSENMEELSNSMAAFNKTIEVFWDADAAVSSVKRNSAKTQENVNKFNSAYKSYTMLLQQGYTCVYWQLFNMFSNCDGFKNREQAWNYLISGVNAKECACLGELAIMYIFGNEYFGVSKDINQAKQILKNAYFIDKKNSDTVKWHRDNYREGIVKCYMAMRIIYENYGGLGESEKEQKKNLKRCLKIIKECKKWYEVKKWVKTIESRMNI